MVMIRPRGSTPHFHRLGNYGQRELSPDDVTELACRADHPDTQALILSCTDMRSVEVIERMESRLGKAVITSNQAMMFYLMRTLGLEHQNNCPGQFLIFSKVDRPTRFVSNPGRGRQYSRALDPDGSVSGFRQTSPLISDPTLHKLLNSAG